VQLKEYSNKTGLSVNDLWTKFSLSEKDGVLITPYYNQDGDFLYNKYRKGKDRWCDSDITQVPYGLKLLPDDGERVYITEGESDLQTLIVNRCYPALGMPGAQSFKPEWVDYLRGFKNVYIVPDNDKAGRMFSEKVSETLNEEEYTGKIFVVNLPEGTKDVNELYVKSPDDFKKSFDELVNDSKPATAKNEKPSNTKAQPPKEIVKYASFVDDGYYLYEQVYDGKETYYLKYDPDEDCVERVDVVIIDGKTYKPIQGEEVEKKAIRLPSGIRDYGTESDLTARIQEFIYRYLDVSEEYNKLASYYTLMSYLYDRLHTLCYLRALGDTGCGKSRFLNVIGGICYKPLFLSVATSAILFRTIEKWGGTFIYDEADLKFSDETNDIVKILNNGFEKGFMVARCDKNNPDKIQFHDVYSPKILATRKSMQDAALEARCFTYTMQETTRSDIPVTLGEEFFREQQELRNMLLLYRFRNYRSINPMVTIDLKNVEPRIRQISSAILPVIANDLSALSDFKKIVANHQKTVIQERFSSPDGQLVNTLFDLIENAQFIEVSTGEKLVTITPQKIADQLGYQWSANRVGQVLRSLKVGTKQTRHLGDNKRFIEYDEKQFAILKKRYIPADDDIAENTGEKTGGTCDICGNSSDNLHETVHGLTCPTCLDNLWNEIA
jgi:hypothetical protein